MTAGCAAKGPFYATKGFSPEQKEQVQKAVAEWERATGGLENIDIVWDADHAADRQRTLVYMSGPPPRYEGEGDDTEIDHYGVTKDYWYANGEYVNVFLWPDMLTADLQYGSALHELGHVFMGLEHSAEKKTLMYPIVEDDSRCITRVDIQRYCDHNGCNAGELYPCDADDATEVQPAE